MVHLSGNLTVDPRLRCPRPWLCVPNLRVLTTSAALAGALALAGCYGDDGYQLPTRAMKELSPEMLALLQQKNMPKESPVLVRVFKEESELEVWKQDTTRPIPVAESLSDLPLVGRAWSEEVEGDRQAPEGFYAITPGLMNPNSNYYLAINIGFPNAYDKSNGFSGAFLMIHGDCSSRGCYAMTDEQIGEIYSLAREAFLGGQKQFQIQAYPFRMTAANLARHRTNPNMPFWKMIKEGDDHFQVTHLEPKVDVCERHYVFDAQPPANSTKPLVFNPTGRCPAFEVAQNIAGPALEKQRNDELQLAQLTKDNVAVAPVTLGTDGGMNRVFASKLETTGPFLDNDGHLHAPPVHPGMPAPTLSAPRSEPANTEIASSGNSRGLFGNLFSAKSSAPQSQVASARHQCTELVVEHLRQFVQAETRYPAAHRIAGAGNRPAGLRPAAELRKSEPVKFEGKSPIFCARARGPSRVGPHPFYAESGGQIGDSGVLVGRGCALYRARYPENWRFVCPCGCARKGRTAHW